MNKAIDQFRLNIQSAKILNSIYNSLETTAK